MRDFRLLKASPSAHVLVLVALWVYFPGRQRTVTDVACGVHSSEGTALRS